MVKPDTPSFRYTEAMGSIKAKELPRYTGDLPLVHIMYISVLTPLHINAIGIFIISAPAALLTRIGTNTAPPNIANICCNDNIIHSFNGVFSYVSYINFFS